MKDSVVWFSQRLTPKLGAKKLQKYLNDFDYGNKDISAGLDDAWLVSPASTGPALKISAYEQLEFMKKLWLSKLPASERAMKLTRDITYLETSPKGFRLSGKTGSNSFDQDKKIQLGWFVSHVENGDVRYLTVTGIRDIQPSDGKSNGGPRAREITKKLLADHGLW